MPPTKKTPADGASQPAKKALFPSQRRTVTPENAPTIGKRATPLAPGARTFSGSPRPDGPRPMAARQAPLACLTSWSYSVYTQYMKCPLSVCFDKVKRIRIAEPPNPAFEKGDRVHKAAEAHVTGSGKPGPVIPELKLVKDALAKFRKLKAKAELEWAFTRQYLPTSWFGPDAWLRIKVDVCAESNDPGPLVQITDWKTGKMYDDHKQQRSLYALGGLQLVELGQLVGGDPATKVVAEHLYTDTGFTATEDFAMKDLKPLKREWESRIKTMMSDTRYPAKTGFHCKWCKFRKSNGGPCPEDQ